MKYNKVINNILFMTMIWIFGFNIALPQGNHHLKTGAFSLTGSHSNIECLTCHTQPESYNGLSSDCESCHLLAFIKASNPSHLNRFYSPSLCKNCHSDVAWIPHTFVHDLSHTQCVTCHSMDLSLTNENVTGHGTLANDCTSCHDTSRWNIIDYNHTSTGYSLREDQKSLKCRICHPDGFLGEKVVCESCNKPDERQIK